MQECTNHHSIVLFITLKQIEKIKGELLEMKSITHEGEHGVFMTDDEYSQLCTLVLERGELIDQLSHVIKTSDMIGIHQVASVLMEGTV